MPSITFYKKDSNHNFSISSQLSLQRRAHIWVKREDGEGMDVSEKEIDNVIYEALDKYFKENF
jgi:hypothetical protein